MATGGGQRNVLRPETRACRKDFVAAFRFRSLGNNVLAGFYGSMCCEPDGVPVAFNVLEHGDGVGPGGTAAPVMISQAAPFGSGPAGGWPA